jgi:hypothetical protein
MPVLNLQVGASGDDGEQIVGVVLDKSAGDLYVGDQFGGFTSNVFARFTGVSGLQGASIDAAIFSTYDTDVLGTPTTTVAFEDALSPTAPADDADMTSRVRTTKVNWDGVVTTFQFNDSPDLAAALAEITDDGDPSVIQVLHDFRGTPSSQRRRYAAYDASSANAAKLDIEYTLPDPGDLNVLEGAESIPDGSAAPRDFGSVAVGAASPQKTFTIENLGDLTISITSIAVPAGYDIDASSDLDGGADTIAGGADKTLVVNLLTDTAGIFSGDITINSDDTDEGTYNFAITGAVATSAGAIARRRRKHLTLRRR